MGNDVAKQQSKIVTFYSYKGGVGRSMALANVAWLLATKYGRQILVVDWDLEAPGLHRFFGIAPTDIKVGLIDLFEEYKTLLKEAGSSLPTKLVDLKKCLISIPLIGNDNGGSLSLIGAGKQDQEYVKRVNAFDWNEFYDTWHGYGFFEYLKTELKENAEVVFLDSRTGVTDIGGICTLQLPDIVVLLFALNEQNLSGTEFIAESIRRRAPNQSEDSIFPSLMIRPARVEKYLEQDKKNEWEEKASKRLVKYLPPEVRENPLDALNFIKENSIPYIGAYGFGETPLASTAIERHADEPVRSFDALAISILKACGFWNEDYSIKEDRERTFTPLRSVRQVLIYLLVVATFLSLLITTLWPNTDSSSEVRISGIRVIWHLAPLIRFLLISMCAGGIGSAISSGNKIVSFIISSPALARQWRRYFFLQPLVGMIVSSVVYLTIGRVVIDFFPVQRLGLFVILGLSLTVGLLSGQVVTRLGEIYKILLISPPKANG